jgi:Flp pilus assembly protein TadG
MQLRSFKELDRMAYSERGSIIVFTTIVIVALMAMVGLAVDAGNLYRARLAMQNAADAAALGAVNYVTMYAKMDLEHENGLDTKTDSEKELKLTEILEPLAQRLAVSNLEQAGYKTASNAVSGSYILPASSTDPFAYAYRATITRQVDYLIMPMIPFSGQKNSTLTVTGLAQRQRTTAVLLLDFSGSMACPAITDAAAQDGTKKEESCLCRTPQRTSECPQTGRRADLLIDAVIEFIKMFDLSRDMIWFVPFSTVAANPQTLIQLNGGTVPTYDQLMGLAATIRTQYSPFGATNICDAMIRGFEQASSGTGTSTETAYVLFTDGAPTAGRFFFTDPVSDITNMPPTGVLNGKNVYDYTHFTLEWVDANNDYRPGPSLLIKSPELPTFVSRPELTSPDAVMLPACTGTVPPKIVTDADITDKPKEVFEDCVTSLGSRPTPRDDSQQYGSDYTGAKFNDWREQYYNCAIALADHVRSIHGTFYVVGLGPDDPTVSQADPYQNINDNFYRKDVLLSRIGLDYKAIEAQKDPTDPTKPLEFNNLGSSYPKFADLKSDTSTRRGLYYPTSDANKLKPLFNTIARKLLLKMTQ